MANGLNVSGITNAAKKKIGCQNPYAARKNQVMSSEDELSINDKSYDSDDTIDSFKKKSK